MAGAQGAKNGYKTGNQSLEINNDRENEKRLRELINDPNLVKDNPTTCISRSYFFSDDPVVRTGFTPTTFIGRCYKARLPIAMSTAMCLSSMAGQLAYLSHLSGVLR